MIKIKHIIPPIPYKMKNNLGTLMIFPKKTCIAKNKNANVMSDNPTWCNVKSVKSVINFIVFIIL